MLEVRSLLAIVCSAYDVEVKASNIPHEIVEWNVFSDRSFGAVEILGY